MPFAAEFDDVYQLGIKTACDETGIYCERVDETHVLGPIYDKIVNAITKADIVVADLTGRNPNVYYETGYAHAQNKVTIHLCQDVKEIPFDLLGFQHIVYSGRIVDLKDKLKEKLLWALDYVRAKGARLGTLSFELYYNGVKVTDEIITRVRKAYRGDGTVGQIHTSFALDIFNSAPTESQNVGPLYVYTDRDIVAVSSSETETRDDDFGLPSPSEDSAFEYRHRLDFRRRTLAAAEWLRVPVAVFFREGLTIEPKGALVRHLKLRFITESTPVDLLLTLRAVEQQEQPVVDFIVGGTVSPESVEGVVQKQLNRSGRIDKIGVQFSLALRNRAARRQKVGPLQVHTTDLCKAFDTHNISVGGIHGGDYYEPSEVEGFSRKFVKTSFSDLDAFEYDSGEFAFELDARRTATGRGRLKLPILIRLFTESGTVEWRFILSAQTRPA
jgi:hypothetical protein